MKTRPYRDQRRRLIETYEALGSGDSTPSGTGVVAPDPDASYVAEALVCASAGPRIKAIPPPRELNAPRLGESGGLQRPVVKGGRKVDHLRRLKVDHPGVGEALGRAWSDGDERLRGERRAERVAACAWWGTRVRWGYVGGSVVMLGRPEVASTTKGSL